MDSTRIKILSEALEALLEEYSRDDPEVAGLFSSLKPLIHQSKSGITLSKMEWRDIPGGYFINEGILRKHRDLEKVFAEFRIELTGGPR